jgi:hypothetical protein
MLNTTYIAMMTIYTLASSPEYTVMLAVRQRQPGQGWRAAVAVLHGERALRDQNHDFSQTRAPRRIADRVELGIGPRLARGRPYVRPTRRQGVPSPGQSHMWRGQAAEQQIVDGADERGLIAGERRERAGKGTSGRGGEDASELVRISRRRIAQRQGADALAYAVRRE